MDADREKAAGGLATLKTPRRVIRACVAATTTLEKKGLD